MTATQDLLTDVPDVGDVPLDAGIALDAAGYARMMRRIGLDGEQGTTVSAFNSSV